METLLFGLSAILGGLMCAGCGYMLGADSVAKRVMKSGSGAAKSAVLD